MRLYNFIFSNTPFFRIPRHLLFWLVVALVYYIAFTGIYLSMPIENENTQLAKGFLSALLSMVLFDMSYCYVFVYFLIPKLFLQKNYGWFIFLSILLTIITLLGEIFLAFFQNGITKPGPNMYALLWGVITPFFNSGAPTVSLIFIAIKMVKQWYFKEEEKTILLRANTLSELQILKAQIHPHFLFNTLNNIYSFTLNNSSIAINLVSKLYDTMKYMITDCDTEFIILQKEIQSLTNYIELEKIRYGNRLQIEVTVTGECTDKMITPLLLIPFVENSFKHGASKMLISPFIKINIEIKENKLYFSLVNNKPAMNDNNNKGIGLTNAKRRLQLLYPSEHYLQIQATENRFIVELHVPLQSSIIKEITR